MAIDEKTGRWIWTPNKFGVPDTDVYCSFCGEEIIEANTIQEGPFTKVHIVKCGHCGWYKAELLEPNDYEKVKIIQEGFTRSSIRRPLYTEEADEFNKYKLNYNTEHHIYEVEKDEESWFKIPKYAGKLMELRN
jgi:transcription elongation factor Elf1